MQNEKGKKQKAMAAFLHVAFCILHFAHREAR
jgi:hypothetical protein